MSAHALPARSGNVLVVDDDEMVRELVRVALEGSGLAVTTAATGADALEALSHEVPDVVVSDVNMPEMDGFTLVRRLREGRAGGAVPFIFLTSRSDADDVVRGLRLGADDYVSKPFQLPELVARVHAKLDRPSVPVAERTRDPRTGLVPHQRFLHETDREVARALRTRRRGSLAVLDIDERASIRANLGGRAEEELLRLLVPLLADAGGPLSLLGRDADGRLLLLLPETGEDEARTSLTRLTEHIAVKRPVVVGEQLAITPVVGWTGFGSAGEQATPAADLVARATVAAEAAAAHLDLQPVVWTPALRPQPQPDQPERRWDDLRTRLRTPLQITATLLLGVLLPFVAYAGLYELGVDVSTPAYLVVVAALLITAASIWTEGFLALDPERPPAAAGAPEPTASAIIAAYLPNEAATVVETVESFLRVDYPDLQVVLAYNTPRPMPVEAVLADIAARDPRFLPLKVEGSTSKAQNVNAALARVRGEFVGVFDADHQPAPDSFSRAWRWLSNGYDVVQGHSVVRNGDASWVARTVAVEFESIYAVSHPGRARLHGFGVFGGSNGYWRTDRLRAIRMHGFMLTEDIDSSLRLVESGGRIANDPALISRELAPTTVGQLWNQRMRWAQGWFQVSLKHLPRAWRSPHLTLRQKAGFTFLLGWREVYPWLALQILPLLAFFAWREGGVANLDWLIAVFVLATLFTLSVGPGQVLFAYRVAAPEVRQHRSWFWSYLLVSSLLYTEWKNIIARVAQIKEFTGERAWKVTPRTSPSADSGPTDPS